MLEAEEFNNSAPIIRNGSLFTYNCLSPLVSLIIGKVKLVPKSSEFEELLALLHAMNKANNRVKTIGNRILFIIFILISFKNVLTKQAYSK
jgi:hypothetical protein